MQERLLEITAANLIIEDVWGSPSSVGLSSEVHVRLLVHVDPILFPLVAAGTDGARRKRGAPRAKQQFSTQDVEDRDPVRHAEGDTSEREKCGVQGEWGWGAVVC